MELWEEGFGHAGAPEGQRDETSGLPMTGHYSDMGGTWRMSAAISHINPLSKSAPLNSWRTSDRPLRPGRFDGNINLLYMAVIAGNTFDPTSYPAGNDPKKEISKEPVDTGDKSPLQAEHAASEALKRSGANFNRLDGRFLPSWGWRPSTRQNYIMYTPYPDPSLERAATNHFDAAAHMARTSAYVNPQIKRIS